MKSTDIRKGIVLNKIDEYNPEGGLAHTAKLFLTLCGINHESTRDHVERVALLAEKVAENLEFDSKATFFAGLLHDVGKMLLPSELFDGHNIDADEYKRVKTHAMSSFEALKDFHLFTALCAGLHHNLYNAGYGITVGDFPESWSPATTKKVLDISVVISICDFVDAFTTRKTKIKDGSDTSDNLESMLNDKYPDNKHLVSAVLVVFYDEHFLYAEE